MPKRRYRLGIDVGGTFTDFVLLDDAEAAIRTQKVLTTPDDPWLAIKRGLAAFATAGVDLGEVYAVHHGTTLVVNALIERTGSTVGLVTTRGFRDILYFGREFRYDIYDPDVVFPDPLVSRQLRREVRERVIGDGTVSMPLDVDEARSVVAELLDEGVEAIAVCLLHSYLLPTHELKIREIVTELADEIPVSLSHEVLPQIREFERCSATVINAYAQPIVKSYLKRLRAGLRAEGCETDLLLMTSSGGTITADIAEAFPIQLVESGPAAGTLAAAFYGSMLSHADVVSFDMGGTTAKACVVRDGKPLVNRNPEVARVRRFKRGSGLPVGVPTVDLLEIGAGGGSIAEIDALGLLRVGPRSAGADPGPVCYGKGGIEPTVTDADVVLGLVGRDSFGGGALRLDVRAAERAIDERIGKPQGLSIEEAAAAVHQVVNENMAEAARVHSVEMNVDIREFGMIAFGGAGPVHAYAVAERLRLPFIICPQNAGVLSALGLLIAPLGFEFARSFVSSVASLDVSRANELLDDLERQGRAMLERAGAAQPISIERSVDMSYEGQRYEVSTGLPAATLTASSVADLGRRFDDTYARAYGRSLAGLPAQCVTWRVIAAGPRPSLGRQRTISTDGAGPQSSSEPRRRVRLPGIGALTCPVWAVAGLQPGTTVAGPALIEQGASTVVVPPGANADVDERRNVTIRLDA
jgi:N-methylhydantoinase A